MSSAPDDCERELEERDAELTALHRRIEELEMELAGERDTNGLMTYGQLFSAVLALLPGVSFAVSVQTHHHVYSRGEPSTCTSWRIWWACPSMKHGNSADGLTAEDALSAFKLALVNTPVPAGDPTGVSKLVGDADVGHP